MMIEFDEYKVKLNGLKPKLDELAASLGIERCKEDIERLHAQLESPGFWDNAEVSQKVMKQARQVEAKVCLLYTSLESGSRKQRTHRLITRGAAIESIAPQTKELSEAEFYSLRCV